MSKAQSITSLTAKATERDVRNLLSANGISPADFRTAEMAGYLAVALADMTSTEWDDENDGARPTWGEVLEDLDSFARREDAPMLTEVLAA